VVIEEVKDGNLGIGGKLLSSGESVHDSRLDLETQIFSASGRGRTFFLTSLSIELIDPGSANSQ